MNATERDNQLFSKQMTFLVSVFVVKPLPDYSETLLTVFKKNAALKKVKLTDNAIGCSDPENFLAILIS